jgi:hypothetical protein
MGKPGQPGGPRYGDGERAVDGRGPACRQIGRIGAACSHRARSCWCRNRWDRVNVAVSGEGGSAPRGLDDGARAGRNQAAVLLQFHRELLSSAARPPAGAAEVGVFSPLSVRSSACLLQNPTIGPPQLGRTDPEHLGRICLGGRNCLGRGWSTRCRKERMGCARFACGVRRRASSIRRLPRIHQPRSQER